jgi:tetratricopeptide (TPR) repeat protein
MRPALARVQSGIGSMITAALLFILGWTVPVSSRAALEEPPRDIGIPPHLALALAWPGEAVLELLRPVLPRARRARAHVHLAHLWLWQNQPGVAALHWQSASELASQGQYSDLEAKAQAGLGDAALHLGELDIAQRANEEAATLAIEQGEATLAISSRIAEGLALRRRGDIAEAERMLQEAAATAQTEGQVELQAQALTHLGVIYKNRGAFHDALHMHQRALELRHQRDDPLALADSYRHLGLLYRASGDGVQALRRLERAADLLRGRPDSLVHGSVLASLAGVLNDTGRFREALASAQRALAIQRARGYLIGTVATLREMGRAHARLGAPAAATDTLNQSLALAERMGQTRSIALARLHLAELAADLGESAAAEEHLMHAIEGFPESDDEPFMYSALALLERLQVARGDHRAALETLRRRHEQQLAQARSEQHRLGILLEAEAGEAARKARIHAERQKLRIETLERRLFQSWVWAAVLLGVTLLAAAMLLWRWRNKARSLRDQLDQMQERLREDMARRDSASINAN